jgi:phosphomannomutase
VGERDESLREQVERWMAGDPDSECRAELGRLLEAGQWEELGERFAGELQFGTAGLRALVGAGPARMNRAVVGRVTAGLCEYLKQTVTDAAQRGLCIGYDARRMSPELAEESAAVAAAAGFVTRVFDAAVPTPLLAFSVLERQAAAGVMITASHNAAGYNGYKVYWGNGAQIIPPHDREIAAAFVAQGPAARLPRLPAGHARERGLRHDLGHELTGRYLEGVRSLPLHPELPRDICIAYTPLHGVGGRLALQALQEAGFHRLHTVAEQFEPDGGFPTLAHPNPEEAGAMQRVLDLARRVKADLVIAHDPDADRMALAAPDRDGEPVALTGDQVGILLAHYLLEQGEGGEGRLLVSSIVSTPLLQDIARHHGARWEGTLTGFKWICNRALELERESGARFVFGFEEALGYTAGTPVRDKDGISSAVLAADMAAWCKHRGLSLRGELERAENIYGRVYSRSFSLPVPGPGAAGKMNELMVRARDSIPERIGGCPVVAVSDLLAGVRREAGGLQVRLEFPTTDLIALELEGGHRVILRPSGTEPKLKLYFHLRQPPDSDGGARFGEREAGRVLQELVDDFLRQLNLTATP